MQRNIMGLFFTLAIAATLCSCKKEKSIESGATVPVDNPVLLEKKWNSTAESVAKDVAYKMNSLAFRKMIRHEVSLRFDGDANILISIVMARLPKYFQYETTHSGNNLGATTDVLSLYNWDILKQAAIDFPQMQIAVQPDAETWDPVVFTPSVVYMPANFDEATHTSVAGFTPEQLPITVSTLEDPDINYVVISQNERTTFRDGELRFTNSNCPVESLVNGATYDPEIVPQPFMPTDCPGGGGGGTGGGGGGTGGGGTPPPYIQYVGTGQDGVLPTLVGRQMGTVVPIPINGGHNLLNPVGTFNGSIVYRKDFRHEKMRFIRCDDIGEIEGWPAGAPEIRMHVFEQNVLNPSENLQIFKEEFKPNRRRDIKNKWWNASDVTMHLWDYQGTGTKASFGYYEYDPVIIPNETLAQIGGIIVDILSITNIADSAGLRIISGSVRNSVVTGIRSLKKKNGMSEYIGKDDYSIFNNLDQFNHSPGETKFKTWPDL
jgi:hypothetical protein